MSKRFRVEIEMSTVGVDVQGAVDQLKADLERGQKRYNALMEGTTARVTQLQREKDEAQEAAAKLERLVTSMGKALDASARKLAEAEQARDFEKAAAERAWQKVEDMRRLGKAGIEQLRKALQVPGQTLPGLVTAVSGALQVLNRVGEQSPPTKIERAAKELFDSRQDHVGPWVRRTAEAEDGHSVAAGVENTVKDSAARGVAYVPVDDDVKLAEAREVLDADTCQER